MTRTNKLAFHHHLKLANFQVGIKSKFLVFFVVIFSTVAFAADIDYTIYTTETVKEGVFAGKRLISIVVSPTNRNEKDLVRLAKQLDSSNKVHSSITVNIFTSIEAAKIYNETTGLLSESDEETLLSHRAASYSRAFASKTPGVNILYIYTGRMNGSFPETKNIEFEIEALR